MKDKKTFKELKEECKREYERVMEEMDYFREFSNAVVVNGEIPIEIFISRIKEFEVPLPPRYLIDKRLKTKTYIVRSSGLRDPEDDNQIIPKPSCLYLRKGNVRKKMNKIDSLFRFLSRYIPEQLLNDVYYSCFVDNNKVIKRLVRFDERKFLKELSKPSKIYNNLTIFDRILWWYRIKRFGGIKSYQLNYPNTDDNTMNKKN